MYFLYGVFTAALAVMLVLGIIEQRRHFHNLARIPTRILINGIRGKSSITRLTAGALRGGGLRVVAKTTGTAARYIHPDTTEEPVYRKFGIANVAEQIGIVRRAASQRPDVLVMECMAVMPALQEINQEKLVRSNIGVLSNVREDHVEEMGPTLDDIARSLSRSMPIGGLCVTAEHEFLDSSGKRLPRRAHQMRTTGPGVVVMDVKKGRRATRFDQLQPGDLLFFNHTPDDDVSGGHSAIYLGVDSEGHNRFVSSRKVANGPTMGDAGGESRIDGDTMYAGFFRRAKRL